MKHQSRVMLTAAMLVLALTASACGSDYFESREPEPAPPLPTSSSIGPGQTQPTTAPTTTTTSTETTVATTNTTASSTTAVPTTTEPPTTTTAAPSFLEQLAGTWTLNDWRERPPDPVTLGMDLDSGAMTVDAFGNLVWDITIDPGGTPPRHQPEARCLGTVNVDGRLIEGVSGRLVVGGQDLIGDRKDWTGNLISLNYDAEVAFCGHTHFGGELFVYKTHNSAYRVSLTTAADAAATPILTMQNDAGTFVWHKTS